MLYKEDLAWPGYLSLVVSSICSTLLIAILVHFLTKTKNRVTASWTYILSAVAIICYSLYSVSQFIMSIYGISSTKDTFDGTVCYYLFLTPCYFTLGKVFVFLFYIVRLYRIFAGSTYAYSKLRLQIFGAFIFVGYISLWIFAVVLAFDAFNKTELDTLHSFVDCAHATNLRASPTNFMLFQMVISMTILLDIIVTVVSLRLYLKRLIYLSLQYDELQSNAKMTEKDCSAAGEIYENQKVDKFYQLTLKITFLLIVTVISSWCLVIVLGLRLGEFWLAIDHTINVFCIYLGFGFNDHLYGRLCGACVAKCCYRCCAPLCFCCCRPKVLPNHMELASTEQTVTSSTHSSNV